MSRTERTLFTIAGTILKGVYKLGSWCLDLLSIPVAAMFQYAIFRPAAAGVHSDEDPVPNPSGDPDQ
jgi:hypothetical protein